MSASHKFFWRIVVYSILAGGAVFYFVESGAPDKILSALVSRRLDVYAHFEGVNFRSLNRLEFKSAGVVGPELEKWADAGKGSLNLRYDGWAVTEARLEVSDLKLGPSLASRMHVNLADKLKADRAVFTRQKSGENIQMTLTLYGPAGATFRAAWQTADKGGV